MLELESLVFKVDTGQLTEAAAKLKALGVEVSNLSKPIGKLTKDQMQAAKQEQILARERAKTAEATAKAAKAEAAAEGATARTAAAQAKAEKATNALTVATKEQQSVLERQQAILDFMTQGMSKGQATTLAYAQATGAATQELKELTDILQTQRKLQGGSPFDKSISGLTTLRNRLTEVREANRLYTAGIQLTREQTRELARDKERIIERLKAEATQNGQLKVSLSDVKAALIAHNIEYIKTATQVNNLINSEKELERQHRDTANAVRALAKEEEKVDSVVATLTGNTDHHTKTSERAAESVARYARNLRLAGVTGVEAATKLEAYRKKITQIQSIEEQRKVDLLSRSLAPQISDVVVSLGSGMNPMTVLLQQGLQVRDLIGQSGVEVAQLQKAFRSAASDMVSSIKGTAVALGSLLIGSIVDTGKALTSFFIEPIKLAGISLLGMAKGTDTATAALERFKLASMAVGKIGIVAAIAALAGLAVGLKKVITEEDGLAKSLALTGGALNITHSSAIQLAQGIESVGITTGRTLEVIAEMGKTGKLTAADIQTVTEAAVGLQKYGGVAIEDTVKSFAKMKEKPVEAMFELARATGMVAPEIIKAIDALVKQGKTSEATALAIKTLADVNRTQINQMKEDYSGFALFIKNLSSNISDFFSGVFKDLWYKADPLQAAKNALAETNRQIQETRNNLSMLPGFLKPDDSRVKQLQAQANSLELQIASYTRRNRAQEDFKSNQNAINSALEKAIGLETTYTSKTQEKAKALKEANAVYDKLIAQGLKTEKDRQVVLAGIEEKYKPSKTPKSEADKLEEQRISKVNAALTVYGDLLGKNEGFLSDFNEKEAHLNFLLAEKLISQGQYNAVFAELLKKQPVYLQGIEEELALLDAQRKARELSASFDIDFEEYVNGLFKSNIELENQLKLVGLSSEEITRLNAAKAQQLITEKKLALIWEESIPGNERRVELLKQEIDYLEKKGILQDDITKATNLAETTKMWTDGITDAITTGLFEGGKAGSAKLRDIIEAELRKPITVFIKAVVGDIVGGVTGTKAGGISSGLSSIGNFLNGSSLTSGLTGKIQYAADWLSTSSNDMLAGLGDTLGKYTNQLGSILGAAGNAFSGYSISKTLSDGYSAGNAVNTIAGIASAFFGPIAGVVGGLVNRLFGRKLKDTGIQGTFSDTGFSGSSYQFYKGGLFSSDKTKTQALGADTTTALGMQFTSMKMQTAVMAAVLNANADEIDAYTKQIKFSTKGLTEAQIQTKFEDIFTGIQNDLAETVLAGTNFAKFGEEAGETLNRLYQSLIAVNGALELVNQSTYTASLAGADLASQLVDAFGDLSTFSSETGAYYDSFFSEQERAAKQIELLTKEFDTLGLTLPASTAGYRALVEAQDLTTEEGRSTFAALIKLSSGFATATQAFESFGNAIEDEINRLRGAIMQDSVNAYAALQSQFALTTAAARAGDSNALDKLPELSSQVEAAFLNQAGSAEDVARVRAWLANSLTTTLSALGMNASAGVNLSSSSADPTVEIAPTATNAAVTSGVFDNTALVTELTALREEVVLLRAEVRADVTHNATTAKLLTRVVPDGDAVQTRVVT